jgi:H/ACA ribonucleoprotein complex subunit 3
MKWLMRRCPACKLYTLKEACPACGMKTVSPHPAKFSPQDKYAYYRARSVGVEDPDKGSADKDG